MCCEFSSKGLLLKTWILECEDILVESASAASGKKTTIVSEKMCLNGREVTRPRKSTRKSRQSFTGNFYDGPAKQLTTFSAEMELEVLLGGVYGNVEQFMSVRLAKSVGIQMQQLQISSKSLLFHGYH